MDAQVMPQKVTNIDVFLEVNIRAKRCIAQEDGNRMDKIQQFYKNTVDARESISYMMKSQFHNLGKDYPSYEWKIKSIKLAPGYPTTSQGLKLYDIVFVKKKRPNLKGHPFRGK